MNTTKANLWCKRSKESQEFLSATVARFILILSSLLFSTACSINATIESTEQTSAAVESPAIFAAPGLSLITPSSSPGNNASPTIRVSGVLSGETVRLYSDLSCSIQIASATASATTHNFALGPLSEGTYNFYSTRTSGSQISGCSATVQYVLDLTAPSAPSGLALSSPSTSPGNDTTPTITVSGVTSGDTIKLFTDSACSTQVGSGAASGTSINLTSSTLTAGSYSFYANATDPAGNTSTCSTATIAYDLDLTAPSAPSGLALQSPSSSPNTEASPTITVSGVTSGDGIKLFSDSSCTTQVGSGTASSTSINITLSSPLSAEGTYNYYANATDPAGNTSTCSTATVEYIYYFYSYVTVDPNVQFVSEGNASVSFTVKISTAKTYAVTLSYNLSGSTAVNGTHHDLSAGTVTIPANQTQASISFNTLENVDTGGAKTLQLNIIGSDRFEVSIGNPSTGMPGIGKMHIDDNDIAATTINKLVVTSDYANPYSRWCAINSNNVLKCWGVSIEGGLGDGSTSLIARTSPVTIDSGTGFSDVVMDGYGGIALTTAGKVKAWTFGGSADASAGDGTTAQRLSPVAIDSATNYSFIYNKTNTKCGITTTGVLKCWGYNYGLLGDGTTTSRTSPVVIDTGTSYSSLVMGYSHRCGITTAGTLKCWGANNYGQLGDGSTNASLTPLVVDSGTSYSKVVFSVSGSMVCGLTTGQKIKCWGNNDMVDNGAATGTVRSPTLVDPSENYLNIASADQYTTMGMDGLCGITTSNKAKCWGEGGYGNLAFSPISGATSKNTPTDVSNGLSISSVVMGDGSSCFITTSNKVLCTGVNMTGQLAQGFQEITPHSVDEAVTYSKIYGTDFAGFYMLTSTGKVKRINFGYGSDTLGFQKGHPVTLDDNNIFSSISPSQNNAVCAITSTGALYCNSGSPKFSLMDSGTNYAQVFSSTNASHHCGITTSNVLKCWGSNSNSQLGDSSTITRTTPVIIDSGTSYSNVSISESSTCGITSSGALKCWGANNYGELGDNTTTTKTTPTIIDSGTNYSIIKKANRSSCGITASGALKCWGRNTNSALGDGTTTHKSTPTLINSGTSYSQVFLNLIYHGCGITTANALKCWGYNYYHLGTGDTLTKSTPTLINSGTSYAKMSDYNDSSVSTHSNCAITTTGVLKCWGYNFWGEVGNGYLTAVSTPAIIDSGVNYSEISTSPNYSCGITSSGLLKCWGGGKQMGPSQHSHLILMSMVPGLDN